MVQKNTVLSGNVPNWGQSQWVYSQGVIQKRRDQRLEKKSGFRLSFSVTYRFQTWTMSVRDHCKESCSWQTLYGLVASGGKI